MGGLGIRRRGRARSIAASAGAALTMGAALALGPGAAWIVDRLADGQRVWRLGRIDIDGVSGPWLGALRAERVTLADGDGVWLEAHDVALNWRPFDLPLGAVRIDAASAADISISRLPNLTPLRPPRGDMLDVRIDALRIDAISIAEPVLGEQARFTAALALRIADKTIDLLDLDLRRGDSDADRAIVFYRAGADYALNIDIEGAAGGVLAHALSVADQNVRLTARSDGDAENGQNQFEGLIGADKLVSGVARWSGADWSIAVAARFDSLPATRAIARRIGASAALNASGARAGAFSARARTPFLALDLDGALDADMALDGPARFTATTQRLSDIAREAPFEFGPAKLTGELRRANGVAAIRATLEARELDVLGRRAALAGPVEAALSRDRFTLSADLRAPADGPALFARARLQTALAYDRGRGRFTLSRAVLDGDALMLDAQGWANRGDGEFSGGWRARKLETLAPNFSGAAAGRWRAFATPAEAGAHVWSAVVDGAGERMAGGAPVVTQLLGASPRLDANFRYQQGGLNLTHARLDGAQLRLGASGRIVRGQADLALEASARGPLSFGETRIDGAADAVGRLTGRLARPSLTVHAGLSSFTAAGVAIEQPQLDFSLTPNMGVYRGQARAQGRIAGQDVSASSDLAFADSAVILNGLVARFGALEARGVARLVPRGATAQLALGGALDGLAPGVGGRVRGQAMLTPDMLTLDANILDARAGALHIRDATLNATGPYRDIAARFDLRGRLGRAPLTFAGAAALKGGELSITGAGALADTAIATRTPLLLARSDAGLAAALDISLGDGAVTASWRQRGRGLAGELNIEAAPLGPFAAIWAERASGRIAGRLRLANSSRGLSGGADLTFASVRFTGRQRGALDLQVAATLDPDTLAATIEARSSEGLSARFEASAPVTTGAAPIRIALAPERSGRARWSVHGPAESLWAAARLQDQTLSGQIDGEGELRFGAGALSGDGRIALTNGRFEDKRSGAALIDLDAEISLGERGVNIERFSASGPRGGRLDATGGSANPRAGRIDVRLRDMAVANRPDARARASGELTLAWEGLHSTLSGALDVAEAEINLAQAPEAGIATLEVIEINRPGEADDDGAAAPAHRGGASRLDVRIRTPGRVFTRGRGVDAEWSLDLRLAGTARAPLLFGEARAIRGALSLSGQPFDIESGRILFDGEAKDARIDLAARRDSANMSARILISGAAGDPDIAFSSDPALPEDEILPQILFGRSGADLSGLEAAQLAAALAALSGRASFDLVEAARAVAGLDRFNLRQDEAGGVLVAGGVYLARGVYVELARTSLGQAASRVEWTLAPRLVLVTSFLGNGDRRASIRWRRESD